MNELIGLPAIVSTRHRIVIDKAFRRLLEIPETGSVQLVVNKNQLQVFPAAPAVHGAVVKDISIGRFNLPMEWVRSNSIKVGDRVFLIATEDCLLIITSVRQNAESERNDKLC